MKRIAIAGLVAVMVLSMLVASAYAEPPTDVGGSLDYIATIVDSRTAGGNSFFTTTEEAIWTGAFEGTSSDECTVVVFATGAWSYRGYGAFEGTVQGQVGTLELLFIGSKPDPEAEWHGTWRILSGGGGLANLHGEGTWWGFGAPGPGVWGTIDYGGQIHFDP